MRVLLVEDDAHTVLYLRQGLSEHGFVPDVAETVGAAVRLGREREYDIVVLDVMLPGGEGWSVLHELRLAGVQTPVIFLTARDAIEDRVRGLEMGADDYLVKPFAFSELLARMRTVLRRAAGGARQPASDVLRVANLEVDLVRRRATRGEQRLTLRPKEFALLALFARRAGEVLTRTFIAEQVWDMNFDSDSNVVDVHVRRLRLAVDEGFQPKLIHTVVGVGYVLEHRA
jgi:two-component system copper resistance phosphate regulon response regulator CusR